MPVHTYTCAYVSIRGDICFSCGKRVFEKEPAANEAPHSGGADELLLLRGTGKLRMDHAHLFPSLPTASYNIREIRKYVLEI